MITAFLLVFAAFLAGCGGLNFSQVSPEAKDFSPSTIAVLPATVGEFESSRSVIDDLASRKLLETGLFEEVKDSATIKTQVSASAETASLMEGYIQRLNTLGISDGGIGQVKEMLRADAFSRICDFVGLRQAGRRQGGARRSRHKAHHRRTAQRMEGEPRACGGILDDKA